MTIAQLATIPERASIIEHVVASLIEQVDRIHLNVAVAVDDLIARDDEADKFSYNIKKWMKHPKIKLAFHDNSLQDGAKFINAPTEPGHYVLVVDDDISYPQNFAKEMAKLLHDPFKDRAILSCMGKVLAPRPIKSYFRDEILCCKTFEEQKALYAVEIPGTCAMIYHTDHCIITAEDMKSPNADICVGAWAKRNGKRCYVIPHGAQWLKDLTYLLPKGSPNMFDRYKDNDGELTGFINANL